MDLDYSEIYSGYPRKTIYQSPIYISMIMDVLEAKSRHLICKLHSSAIPLLYKSTSFGRVYNSLPFFGSCGGIVGNNNFCVELQTQILALRQEISFASLNIISNWYNQVDLNSSSISFNVMERINTVKELEGIEGIKNAALSTYHSKTRNIVRATLKNDFEFCDLSDQFEIVTKIYFDEMNLKKRFSKPIGFWEYLIKNRNSKLDYVIYGAKKEGKILGFVLFIYNEELGQVEYFIPGSTPEGRKYNVNYFLIHSAIIEFSKQKFDTIHFGGSHINQIDLIRFKQRWGSQTYSYKYFNTYSKKLEDLSNNFLTEEAPYFYIKPFTV